MYKNLFLPLCIATSLFADVTMCYKENFTTPSKIETISLDGGSCDGKYSVTDMKKNGWNIKDITISKGENGMNYTYIFSKDSISNIPTAVPTETLKEQLILLDKQKEEKVKNDKEEKALVEGKKTYEKQCSKCHGLTGELEPHTSSKLIGMSSEDFDDSMRAYNLREKDKGAAILMNPYTLMSGERKDVIKYLESIQVLVKPLKK